MPTALRTGGGRAGVARACALLLSICLLGCRFHVPQVAGPGPALQDPHSELQYQRTLDRYTVRGELYQGLDTRAFVAATYQSWQMREARVRRLAAFRAQPPEQVEQLLADERLADAQSYELFFGAHLNEPRYDDFDRPGTIWRLALVVDGQELAPVEIRRIGRSNLELRALYPYLDTFWVGYWLRFPRAQGGAPVAFKVASTLGKLELALPAR